MNADGQNRDSQADSVILLENEMQLRANPRLKKRVPTSQEDSEQTDREREENDLSGAARFAKYTMQ